MNLREAAGQALEALLIWQDSLTDPSAIPGWRFSVVGEKAVANLRAALTEDAMQRLTDVQQETNCYGDGNVYRGQRSSDSKTPTLTFSKAETVEPVAWRYIPSERLRDVVLTSDPSQARLAADYGCEVQPLYPAPPKHAQTWTQAHWTEYERGIVSTERERIAAWVEDMCVGLDAKTIANGIRNGGNDDIRAFEVRR